MFLADYKVLNYFADGDVFQTASIVVSFLICVRNSNFITYTNGVQKLSILFSKLQDKIHEAHQLSKNFSIFYNFITGNRRILTCLLTINFHSSFFELTNPLSHILSYHNTFTINHKLTMNLSCSITEYYLTNLITECNNKRTEE